MYPILPSTSHRMNQSHLLVVINRWKQIGSKSKFLGARSLQWLRLKVVRVDQATWTDTTASSKIGKRSKQSQLLCHTPTQQSFIWFFIQGGPPFLLCMHSLDIRIWAPFHTKVPIGITYILLRAGPPYIGAPREVARDNMVHGITAHILTPPNYVMIFAIDHFICNPEPSRWARSLIEINRELKCKMYMIPEPH